MQELLYFDMSNTLLDIYNIGIVENNDISYIIENKIKSIKKIYNKNFELILISDFNLTSRLIEFNINNKFTSINTTELIINIKQSKGKEIYIYNKNDIILKLLNIDHIPIHIINSDYKITNISDIQNNLYNKITKKCKYLLLDKKRILLDITFLLTFLEYKNVIYNSENIIYDTIIYNYILYLNQYNSYIVHSNCNINFINFKNYLLYFINESIKSTYNYNFNYNSKNHRYLKNLQYKFLHNIDSDLTNWEIYNINISLINIIIYIEKYNTFIYNVKM